MYGNAAAALDTAPLLFSLEELENCDTRPKKKTRQLVLKYFENPKNDNEILFNLQKSYYDALNANDDKTANSIYWQMWQLTAKVARRIINKKIKGRGLEFAPDEINDKVSDTCEYLLRRFKFIKNYCVTTNWIIAIRDSARHATDYQTELDKSTDILGDFSVINNALISQYSGRRIDEGEN